MDPTLVLIFAFNFFSLPQELRDYVYGLLLGPVIRPYLPRVNMRISGLRACKVTTVLDLLCVDRQMQFEVMTYIFTHCRIEFNELPSLCKFLQRSYRPHVGLRPAPFLTCCEVVCTPSNFGKIFDIDGLYTNYRRERDEWKGVHIGAFFRNLGNLDLKSMIIWIDDIGDDLDEIERFGVLERLKKLRVGGSGVLAVWTRCRLVPTKQLL